MPATIKRVEWSQVRPRVQAVAKELARALDPIAKSLKEQSFVYEVELAYGDLLIDKGCLTLSHNRDTADRAPGLSSAIPICMVLDKHCEVFYGEGVVWTGNTESMDQDPITSINLLGPGDLFGVFETLDGEYGTADCDPGTWSVAAGARSATLVYRMGNERVVRELPHTLSTHTTHRQWGHLIQIDSFPLLSALSCDSDWRAKVAIFPNQWVPTNLAGNAFGRYIHQFAWRQMRPHLQRSTLLDDLLRWLPSRQHNLKLNTIGVDAAANLLVRLEGVAAGREVGYRLIGSEDDCDLLGPFTAIQTALSRMVAHISSLRDRPVAFMVPSRIEPGAGASLWVSLHEPALKCIRQRRAVDALGQLGAAIRGHPALFEKRLPTLDLTATRFFTRAGSNSRDLPMVNDISCADEDCAPELVERGNVFTSHRFFNPSARVVRRGR